ncbi:MAG TPA: zinc-binding dehydrogenase [Candidatus Acidoferrales bacterium]|nr:zinc-binding dehydrogenase [Candidatus Acidoferrales bacterium]
MRAIVIPKHGGPEVLQLTELPNPQPGPSEVVVRVRACALNHLDLWVRRGLNGVTFSLPLVPGSDISGEVAVVGTSVQRVHVGDKVVLAPGVSCGQCSACAAGRDNECRKYTLFGYGRNGGCAEFVLAPEVNVLPMPPGLSFEEAAAVPLVFLTAWHMLIGRARLQPAEEVLILGAGSGVGSAAVQIAKLSGARVIATAGSRAKLDKARELGADEVIDHSQQKISEEVRRLTAKRGVDVVFEHVGVATWEQSILSLATGGRLVTCGATTGSAAQLDLRYLFARQLSLLGSYMGSRAELFTVLKLVGERKLHPVIDRVFPLAEAVQAHRRLEQREQFGKIVLKIS